MSNSFVKTEKVLKSTAECKILYMNGNKYTVYYKDREILTNNLFCPIHGERSSGIRVEIEKICAVFVDNEVFDINKDENFFIFNQIFTEIKKTVEEDILCIQCFEKVIGEE